MLMIPVIPMNNKYNCTTCSIQFSQHQTHLGYRTVKFKGSQLSNRLPHHLVEITSPASFRKSLKHYLTYNPM